MAFHQGIPVTFIPPSHRSSHPVLQAVAASAASLAIGLPFLFVLTRTAQFYGYADTDFGFWLATRALPIWAVLSLGLGAITGLRSARTGRPLGSGLAVASLIAVMGAIVLSAVALGMAAPLRKAAAEQAGLQPVPLGHFLVRHLLEDPSRRKLDFDTCMLTDAGLYRDPGAWRPLTYEFCIPDSEALKSEVSRIDTTVRFSDQPGRIHCGPGRILCRGNTHQAHVRVVLQRLSSLPYIRQIRGVAYE